MKKIPDVRQLFKKLWVKLAQIQILAFKNNFLKIYPRVESDVWCVLCVVTIDVHSFDSILNSYACTFFQGPIWQSVFKIVIHLLFLHYNKSYQKVDKRRSKDDPKTIQKQPKNDPKTIQERFKNNLFLLVTNFNRSKP